MDLDPGGMGGVEIPWKIVLGQTGLIFFTAFADGFGPRGMGAGQVHRKIVGRKSVLLLLAVFTDGFGSSGIRRGRIHCGSVGRVAAHNPEMQDSVPRWILMPRISNSPFPIFGL